MDAMRAGEIEASICSEKGVNQLMKVTGVLWNVPDLIREFVQKPQRHHLVLLWRLHGYVVALIDAPPGLFIFDIILPFLEMYQFFHFYSLFIRFQVEKWEPLWM